ncbi:TraR/DksA family transcriptional regulator [Mesorhizobium xinjiangense]|uniref:TraR/DksA family transcriptional regulator n=1 Tax=Mesorhizobium xinjiangense TaxID=2678685 RepID=UPI0012EDDCD1|nr:TraR/DksA C4-type zinc finger protein [Mesorhizobium xinjiangense]
MLDMKKRKTQLKKRLAELDVRLKDIEDQLDDAPNPDWGENAAEHEGDEVLESLGSSGLAEYRGIKAALQRIKDGTYGVCVKCGEDISPERLDLLPHTPFCKDCAKAN